MGGENCRSSSCLDVEEVELPHTSEENNNKLLSSASQLSVLSYSDYLQYELFENGDFEDLKNGTQSKARRPRLVHY